MWHMPCNECGHVHTPARSDRRVMRPARNPRASMDQHRSCAASGAAAQAVRLFEFASLPRDPVRRHSHRDRGCAPPLDGPQHDAVIAGHRACSWRWLRLQQVHDLLQVVVVLVHLHRLRAARYRMLHVQQVIAVFDADYSLRMCAAMATGRGGLCLARGSGSGAGGGRRVAFGVLSDEADGFVRLSGGVLEVCVEGDDNLLWQAHVADVNVEIVSGLAIVSGQSSNDLDGVLDGDEVGDDFVTSRSTGWGPTPDRQLEEGR